MKPVLTLCAQPLFEARGSPIRVKAFLRALGNAKIPSEVITLPVGPEASLPESVRIRRVPNILRVQTVSIGPSLPKLFFGILIAGTGLVRAIPGRYRIVHGIEEMGLPAWIIARLTGARFIYEKHSDPASYQNGSLPRKVIMGLYARVEKFVCRRADVIVATGPGTGQQARFYRSHAEIEEIDDVPSDDCEATDAKTEAWRKRIGTRGGETTFAYIGSFAAYQGVSLFLDAADAALRKRTDLRLALVGKSPEIEEVLKRAEAGGYADRIFYCPSIPPDEVADFLAACEVLVSPRLEGHNTPLKVLDYLRSGRSILATNTPANRLVLDETVALITSPDPQSIASAMETLADRPETRKVLGKSGRKFFKRRFGFDRFERAYLRIFAVRKRNTWMGASSPVLDCSCPLWMFLG